MKVFQTLVLSALIAAAAGESVAQDIVFGGQVRPRFELREPVNQGRDTFTSMRVRAQMKASLDRDVGLFIPFQDVRLVTPYF